ncbi:putative leucine-rich repeat-containing protein DDB_G0290503 [Mercenaria mercenaria]|uniref:putative leucine-rich repeat-containing protein DDB_G0290503 n=1 Tax=Mercenaria mercenaria TaxID=6596 RepID=UPI00234E498B|nr:putative leucine-rich repeat-containing protein DDB_G0290503 [Mercenaria mercenaria]XP_053383069.1 putative leucine-rich repeat-containing protein DDB_G0290503 [Mercenaria mercenaria]
MDKRQKSTLRSQHIRIADELILDEDFYAALRRDKIFTNGMLDLIKAEAKPRDRVYKMLELLEKRGPKAFENFVWILKENYEWLAKELEDQYNKRLQQTQQERDKHDQGSVQYETYPKYFSQDIYNRVEEYSNPNNRAVSTTTHHQRARHTMIPTQESVSAGYCYNKDSQQFFPTPGYNLAVVPQHYSQQQHQDGGLDTTDNIVQTFNETNSEPQRKQYKDACMSPIGIIESPRKSVHATSGPKELKNDRHETESEEDSCDQGFDEIKSQTATVTTLTNDDVESQITSTTEARSEGFEHTDIVDGPEDVNVGLDENDEDFPTSEVYYDCVRRGSSHFSQFDEEVFQHELSMHDDENDVSRSEISFEHTEAFQIQIEAMKNMYIKLVGITFENEDTDDTDENEVTWEMIDCEMDRLINRLENSDDMKMIRKCYDLFPEKERKQPLNMCIESVLADKKELDNKLRDKQKEIDQMVFDLWKHQQDMSNFKKLQKRLTEKETEYNNLKTSLDNLEKDADTKFKQIAEKDARIEALETKVKELQGDQMRKLGMPTRRGAQNQRRTSNIQGQSPRRQSTNYTEPRMSLMQGAYGNGNQSPRNVTTAMRRAPSNRR